MIVEQSKVQELQSALKTANETLEQYENEAENTTRLIRRHLQNNCPSVETMSPEELALGDLIFPKGWRETYGKSSEKYVPVRRAEISTEKFSWAYHTHQLICLQSEKFFGDDRVYLAYLHSYNENRAHNDVWHSPSISVVLSNMTLELVDSEFEWDGAAAYTGRLEAYEIIKIEERVFEEIEDATVDEPVSSDAEEEMIDEKDF